MSADNADKQRRRELRLQAARERRARLRRVLAPCAAITVAMGALAYAALRGGGAPAAPAATAAQTSSPFGQHYADLVARRSRARVPTMMQTMSSPWHFHPLLALFVNGKAIKVPANIGIDPQVDGMQMAGLHTHDDSGTIHVEGLQHATLGQFMTIWGVALSAQRLGSYHASGNVGVRMWVDGKPSQAFGSLALADGQKIVLSYGPLQAPRPRS